ncbi:MAG: hypothetical protein ACRDSR_14930 [Pseudonocardiaceae bacterium]
MAGFEQADAQLAAVAQQQFDLRAAVDAGELWMDADVAERAAARCDQAVRELNDWLAAARILTIKRKFGDNEDGNAAADRFVQAGHEFIESMRNAQQVIANMAATFRAAGRTAAEADEAGRQMFQGTPE